MGEGHSGEPGSQQSRQGEEKPKGLWLQGALGK